MCTNIFSILTLTYLHVSLFTFSQTAEQYLISSSGGILSASKQTMTFTVGEIATETFSSTDLLLTQGFLQAEDISIGTGDPEYSSADILIYPNPATSFFNIDFIGKTDDNIHYLLKIIDINGKYIHSQNIKSNKIKIDMSTYRSGTYFIKLINLIVPETQVKIIQKVNY